MSLEGFFSKQNIHTQIWAGIVGVFGFALATSYNALNGPARVIVETESADAKPISVNVVQGNGVTKKEFEELTAAISALNEAASRKDSQNQQAQQAQLNLVKQELAKLQTTLERQKTLERATPIEGSKESVSSSDRSKVAPTTQRSELDKLVSEWHNYEPGEGLDFKGGLKVPALSVLAADSRKEDAPKSLFTTPSTAKGYTSVSIRGVKNSYCPPDKLRSGVPITGGFELSDSSLLRKASPILMTVSKIHGPYSQSQIDHIESPLALGVNSITSTARLEPGNYDVSYGYYLLDKLSGEYPPFYSKRCIVTVLSRL